MTFKPEEIVDLRSQVTPQAHDRFASDFMKFANEAKETPKADTKTEGSVESNIDVEVADTNHISKNHGEQKGICAEGKDGEIGYLSGQQPPKDVPLVAGGRSPQYETLSTSAEEINAENTQDLLRRGFSNTEESFKEDKAVIKELFDHARDGKFVTRAQSLMDRVRGKTGRV